MHEDKVIKKGNSGEVHYFEHESGQVAGVKFFLEKIRALCLQLLERERSSEAAV